MKSGDYGLKYVQSAMVVNRRLTLAVRREAWSATTSRVTLKALFGGSGQWQADMAVSVRRRSGPDRERGGC
jgi:hypothetical protein